jgi:hypothetical protein
VLGLFLNLATEVGLVIHVEGIAENLQAR